MAPLDLGKLKFVGESLTALRAETRGAPDGGPAILGFIGSPWTLATYLIEGGSSQYYKTIKAMAQARSAGAAGRSAAALCVVASLARGAWGGGGRGQKAASEILPTHPKPLQNPSKTLQNPPNPS